MIAFDTNHLLRHILQDDAKQCAHVAKLLKTQGAGGGKIHLLDLVLMETCWVLQSVYELDREGWCGVLAALLSDAAFGFDDSPRLREALTHYREGAAEFDDYLILTHAQAIGAKLETFDRKLKKSL
jgi:predicted nucleic-acid-binding protein